MAKYDNTIILIKLYSHINKVIGLQILKLKDKVEIIPVGTFYKIYNIFLTIVVSSAMFFSMIKVYTNLKTVSVVHKFTILISQGTIVVTYIMIMLPCSFSDPEILLTFRKVLVKVEKMLRFDSKQSNNKFVLYLIKSYGSYILLKFFYLYLSRNLRFWLLHFSVITIELEAISLNVEMYLVSRRLEFLIEKIKNQYGKEFGDLDIKQGILHCLWKEKYDIGNVDIKIVDLLNIHDCLCKCVELINERFANKVNI